MNNRKQDYYNQEIFWKDDLYSIQREKIRIDEIVNNIPEDVQTIVDIGCGNGTVLNKLLEKSKYSRLVGVDFSETALKYVKTEKYLMNIIELKFQDKSFDLVICNEVIEHLPYYEYYSALKEISRIAKKYIIITTPNQEDLESTLVCCPECKTWFNQEYHVRSFSTKKLSELFTIIDCKLVKEIGNEKLTIKQNRITRIFNVYNLNRKPAIYAKCPQCELNLKDYYMSNVVENVSLTQRLFSKFTLIFLKKQLYKPWLLALYERK